MTNETNLRVVEQPIYYKVKPKSWLKRVLGIKDTQHIFVDYPQGQKGVDIICQDIMNGKRLLRVQYRDYLSSHEYKIRDALTVRVISVNITTTRQGKKVLKSFESFPIVGAGTRLENVHSEEVALDGKFAEDIELGDEIVYCPETNTYTKV